MTHWFCPALAAGMIPLLVMACMAAPAPPVREPRVAAVLKGHGPGKVATVAFSADGKTVVTGSPDRTIRVWDVATGKCLRTIVTCKPDPDSPLKGRVYALALSPDGRTVVSGSDTLLKVWDLETGKQVRTVQGPRSWFNRFAFSPDGKRLISDSGEGAVRLWDFEKGETQSSFRVESFTSPFVAFSSDGQPLAASIAADQRSFTIWDAAKGNEVVTCAGHTKAITALAHSRDGKTVASCGDDHTVRLWDASTGKQKAEYTIAAALGQMEFSPNDRFLAIGYKHQEADGVTTADPQRWSVRLYDIATGRFLALPDGDPTLIGPLVFSPDGRLLTTATAWDSVLKIWRLPDEWVGGR